MFIKLLIKNTHIKLNINRIRCGFCNDSRWYNQLRNNKTRYRGPLQTKIMGILQVSVDKPVQDYQFNKTKSKKNIKNHGENSSRSIFLLIISDK